MRWSASGTYSTPLILNLMIKYFTILPIVLYLIYVVIKYGVQKSISESYYQLSKKDKPLFTFALVLTSMNLAGVFIYYHPELKAENIILFLAATGICYTAVAAEFKESTIINTWHLSGAISGYILGYVFIVLHYGWMSTHFMFISLVLSIGVWVLEVKKENKYITYSEDENIFYRTKKVQNNTIWWIEIIGLLTIYLATL